ncbi:extracellular solute-binding protein [Clostridium cadaveris]|uniref:extracellular solute-binding protein n=1 Tax=Clostridium cadaveris TaxID=1529 RepID=UPI000C07CD77|nr:extracellular solute-binding protein [Clostridium cadaveris]NME64301.1 extracellular solute-binding protein [Clostridium cadaveris]UFH65980.1 extracellular solute-binding protein [Clostridium cadaveris]
MATIKDIAKLAGVSHGTVSNVLNKRGNVSVEKIKLVENAAKELGFTLNAQAKQLRASQSNRVAVIIPGIYLKRYNDLYMSLNNVLISERHEVDVFCTNNLIHEEEQILEKVLAFNPKAVVIVSSMKKNTIINRNSEVKFYFVERMVEKLPKKSKFISFDFIKAGHDIAKLCIKNKPDNVAFFCGDTRFTENKQFMQSAVDEMEQRGIPYDVFRADDSMGFNVAFDIMFSEKEYDAIITTNIENVDYFKAIKEFNPEKKMPAVYTLASSSIGPVPKVFKYEMNYKLMGRMIANDILFENEKKKTVFSDKMILNNDGFYMPVSKKIAKKDEELKVLMLKSPTCAALKKLIPSFTMETGIKVKLIDMPYDELYGSVKDNVDHPIYDILRMDVVWLSQFNENLFMPLNIENEVIKDIKKSFSKSIPEDYFSVNGITYTLPFDPSVQMLYYRKDLFEDALIKREFYETYKRQLDVPENYKEYMEVAKFFTRKFNANSPTEFGVSQVFGAPVAAACDFMPQFKAMKGSIFDENHRVNIDTPIMKKAMLNYIEANKYADGYTNLWWVNPIEQFSKGKIAMNVFFSNHAANILHNPDSKVIGKIGFAQVPGKQPLLGGGVIGISKDTKKEAECYEFLKWIYRDKIVSIITYLGGYINNERLLDKIDILELYPWIEGMEEGFRIGSRFQCDDNSKFDEYKFEEIIGKAIRSTTLGVVNINDALKEAQLEVDKLFNSKSI